MAHDLALQETARPARRESRPARHARSFRGALARMDLAQKPGAGVPAYTRWVNRRLARYAAAAAYRVGLSPNAVSVMSLAVSLSGLALLVLLREQPVLAGSATAVLLALGYVLDSADGQLARLSGTANRAGEWLDHVFDAIRSPAVHLVVAAGFLLQARPGVWAVVLAAAFALLVTAQFMSQMLAGMMLDAHSEVRARPRPLQSWVLLPTDTGVLCWVFVLWGWPVLFAAAYTALFLVNAVHAGTSMRRRFHELVRAGRSTR